MAGKNRELPRVGLGVIILNEQGQVLIGKRTGSHAPFYSIPGGSLELGETFEQGAIREIEEEHGIKINDPQVIAITNNLDTYKSEGFHSMSVILLAKSFEGTPIIKEPHKCTEILWAYPKNVPQPHFDASQLALRCYLENKVYVGIK